MRIFLIAFFCLTSFCVSSLKAEKIEKPVNKLLYMYHFFYFPFSIEFEEDKEIILPFFPQTESESRKIFEASDLKLLQKEWDALRFEFYKKSLIERSLTSVNQNPRVSFHIYSYNIPLYKTVFEKMNLSERMELVKALKDKAPEIQSSLKQVAFFRSFIDKSQLEKFNFFIIGASWCSSSREYRILFETYVKQFPNDGFVFHSIVINDPDEKIFNSDLMNEMFPHENRYSHQTIPRFIALQSVNGKIIVWEEGEALKEFYERYFVEHMGYLNEKISILKRYASKKIKISSTKNSFFKK